MTKSRWARILYNVGKVQTTHVYTRRLISTVLIILCVVWLGKINIIRACEKADSFWFGCYQHVVHMQHLLTFKYSYKVGWWTVQARYHNPWMFTWTVTCAYSLSSIGICIYEFECLPWSLTFMGVTLGLSYLCVSPLGTATLGPGIQRWLLHTPCGLWRLR